MTRLLLSLVLCLPTVASAATVCVNTTGAGGCFPTIQQGVDAAVSGDTVDVAAGTYFERVVVAKRKRIRLQGAGPAATIIDGNGVGTVLKIKGPNPNMLVTALGIRNGDRGLVFGERVKINVSDCAITGNVGGGGISGNAAGSNVTVTRCTITGNSSDLNGGGIDLNAPPFPPLVRVKVVSSTIRGNAAAHRGGGILVDGGKLTLIDSSVEDNSAEFSGGIVADDVTVAASTIARNTSLSGSGGGITANTAVVRNSTISSNATAGAGGGVNAGVLRLEHATIATNTAELAGGGISAGRVTLRASLVGDNSAPSGGDCRSDQAKGVGVNLIEDASSCDVTTTGESVVINVDPMLGPLQNNGGTTETQALLAGSPAIGVVTTTALCKAPDQRGEPRTVPCDLGAYEAP